MNRKKSYLLLLLVLLCMLLAGCRTRTKGPGSGSALQSAGASVPAAQDPLSEESADEADPGDSFQESGGKTKENPDSPRKEYDGDASAEIIPGTESAVHGEGTSSGTSAAGDEEDPAADKLNGQAAKTALQTVPAPEAERLGVSEEAERADSSLTYFTVLLQDRMGSLFECKRQYVYWETAEDHVTVHKSSPEHSLILSAGAYDVSARLLKENLRVDDGWVCRKNPGLIVKIVGRGVLGSGAVSDRAARSAYAALTEREGWAKIDAVRSGRVILLSEELLATQALRTASMLLIAKTASPDIMADVDISQALAMLAQEESGRVPEGIYFYTPGGNP